MASDSSPFDSNQQNDPSNQSTDSLVTAVSSSNSQPEGSTSSPVGAPEGLGAGEMIEVHAFLERKSWIEDKIKQLEAMPPIDVFIGVEHLLPTNYEEPIPGVPTRQQLAEWLSEHEKIEAETEQFDKGDMLRLKKFAKAKSKQNLSPEDTDLIELTLDTLFALDKLIHLLRGRADSLEQLGLRLTWEELRIAAWKDRRSILSDMDAFIKTRARWSPSVYDVLRHSSSPNPNATDANTQVPTIVEPTDFLSLSRSARFKLSETLSHEAAAYASRVMSFRNTWINPSANALDKLIEKRTVPDQLLDEQDRLEDQTKEMDGLAKFPMQLVMQWKKADEIYGELKKDQAAAETLQKEVETALQQHPSGRLDASFMSRSSALSTRLSMISDPMTSRSFPRPSNPSYPDQREANEVLTTLLSTELRAVVKSARSALNVAKQHHTTYEAVKKVELQVTEMKAMTNRYKEIATRYQEGTTAVDGDGSPPNLENAECLDPLRHGAFLALLPSLTTDLESLQTACDKTIPSCRSGLFQLKRATLDEAFMPAAEAAIADLENARDEAIRAKAEVEKRAVILKDVRKVWVALKDRVASIASMREQVLRLVDSQKWKTERNRDGAPLTPESPSAILPGSDLTPELVQEWMDSLKIEISSLITIPTSGLKSSIGARLSDHIAAGQDNLELRLGLLRELTDFWNDVRNQAAVMKSVRDDTHDLEYRIEELRLQLQDAQTAILSQTSEQEMDEDSLRSTFAELQKHVNAFCEGLASRVPFVTSTRPDLKRGSSTTSLNGPTAFENLPFSPSALDHGVRTDANAFTSSVNGGIDSLTRSFDHLNLAYKAKGLDQHVDTLVSWSLETGKELESLSELFWKSATVEGQGSNLSFAEFQSMAENLTARFETRSRELLPVLRQSLQDLEASPGSHDLNVFETVIVPRKRRIDNAATRVERLGTKLAALRDLIVHAESALQYAADTRLRVSEAENEIIRMTQALEQLDARIEGCALDKEDAAEVLQKAREELNNLGSEHQQSLQRLIANVMNSRGVLQNAPAFEEPRFQPLFHPIVNYARELETKGDIMKPRTLALMDKINLHLSALTLREDVKTQVQNLKAATKAAEETLASNTSRYASTSPAENVLEADLRSLLEDISKSNEDCSQSITTCSVSASNHLTTLANHPTSATVGAALVANLQTKVQKEQEHGSQVIRKMSDLRQQVEDHLQAVSMAGSLDTKVTQAFDALTDFASQFKVISEEFDSILASLPEYEGSISSPTASKLAVLRTRLESFSRTAQTLLDDHAQSIEALLNALEALPLSRDQALMNSIAGPKRLRVEEMKRTADDFSANIKTFLDRVLAAEQTEAERIAMEIANREAAEQERLRLEAEEKAQRELEAALLREAQEQALREAEERARQLAEEKLKLEEAERIRLKAEEEARQEREEREKKELEAAREKEERDRKEKEALELERRRLEAEEQALNNRIMAEQIRQEVEAQARASLETVRAGKQPERPERRSRKSSEVDIVPKSRTKGELDVFGLKISPSSHKRTASQEIVELHNRIVSLRIELKALGLHSIVRPTSKSSPKRSSIAPLPTEAQALDLQSRYNDIVNSASSLPSEIDDSTPDAELRSLHFELHASRPLATRVELLGQFSTAVTEADAALSDLLEHVDMYPAAPTELSSSHKSDSSLPPEEQLSSRIGFAGASVDRMKNIAEDIQDDPRVRSEKERIEEMWKELWEMSMEKINNPRSRPASSIMSTSESVESLNENETSLNTPTAKRDKRMSGAAALGLGHRSRAASSISRPGSVNGANADWSSLSIGGPGRIRPSMMANPSTSRCSSRVSTRSVSGPANSSSPMPGARSSSTLYGSTFSSRQRTISNSSSFSPSGVSTPTRDLRTSTASPRPRTQLGQVKNSHLSPSLSPSESSTSRPSLWAGRTPKTSTSRLGPSVLSRSIRESLPRGSPSSPPKKRKPYVPNEKHKVDVAVAKVVNTLDEDCQVNIEPVSWKDQSGKYWIGDTDPKLYFCRILRSQTVMVRVGGGWMELSKFLKGHYDLFRVMPTPVVGVGSPPGPAKEEKWISSATLLEAANTAGPSDSLRPSTPSRPPTTPEPRSSPTRAALSPRDSFSTPKMPGRLSPLVQRGHSPMHSVTSGSPGGSPLTPLQFMRKAEDSLPNLPSVMIRPTTPSHSNSYGPTKAKKGGRATPITTDDKRSTGLRGAGTGAPPARWRV
ncbi:hypothetical protein FRC02_007674 [Tulasnella sp. 418]|nr:hypothetical protein FRC02_007674 [Tulasnella sp. 418]